MQIFVDFVSSELKTTAKVLPKGFWNLQPNHKKFFDWSHVRLGYKHMRDWYNISADDIQKNGGGGLLQRYNNSVSKALQNVYPNHRWKLWMFKCSAVGHLEKKENREAFFQHLKEYYNCREMEDWYNITAEDIYKQGGQSLLVLYEDSVSRLLADIYPQHNWMVWKFKDISDHWERRKNHKLFFDWLGDQLGYKSIDEWYNLTWKDLYTHGGLLNYSSNSISDALSAAYPKLIPSKINLHKEYWDLVENKKMFYEWLGSKFGYKDLDDWYNLGEQDIFKHAGQGVTNYCSKPATDLPIVYPQHKWMTWRFSMTSRKYWDKLEKEDQKNIVDWLQEKLCINCPEDWYRISLNVVKRLVPLPNSNLLHQMLRTYYPTHKWDSSRLNRMGKQTKASQRELIRIMQELFPSHSKSIIFDKVNHRDAIKISNGD